MKTSASEKSTIKAQSNIHELPVSEVYASLGTTASGLSKAEAASRLKQLGSNTIEEAKGKPLILKFLLNFTHLMAILLWVGGIIGFLAQLPELGIAIWLVNIINGIFSFFQEYRAEKATEALRKLLPAYARVLRDGEEQRILAGELVPGDVILLTEGDRISADARLVENSDLRSDQSTLTGESHAVHKTKDPLLRGDLARTDEPNLVFAGTNVAAGTGTAVVFATGMNTEFGEIAGLTQEQKEEPSPLQKELKHITRTVTFMAVSIGTFFFIASVLIAKVDIAESFIFSMGMIIAFVPEGLLPTVTLSLAMGVQRMAKRNALIKRLSAVETLGCTTVICTDKTGTLTQNEMTVSDIWLPDQQYKITGVGYAPEGEIKTIKPIVSQRDDQDLNQLLVAGGLCNNARLVPPGDDARWTVLGDPTEAAMLVTAQKNNLDLAKEAFRMPRLRELPFESHRKRMSTIHGMNDPDSPFSQVTYVKGAPREVLDLCTQIQENGQARPLDETRRAEVMTANDDYARNGLRVLAIALRFLPHDNTFPSNMSMYTPDLIEQDLTFLGLIAMADPPRQEVADAVKKCHHSSIRIIMITGDYGLTAESIARRIGIIKGPHPRILTGTDLEEISAETLKEALMGEVIFARVAPEQKLRVVTALQDMGHVVAVTGDGVNDSPALKKADIGVAMGISGTDVAKEAADMILTDDNFASIVNAVEEGRAVYSNIRKFAVYIFNSNVSEAVPFILFLFSRGTIPLPLTIMQILAMDLGTDMVPAIGLGAELPESEIMDRPPRSQNERLLSRKLLFLAFFWYGILESVISISAYFYLNWLYGWPGVPLASSGTVYMMATTMTLTAIVLCQVGVVFNCRTQRASIFTISFFSNRIILIGIAVELILICLLIYVPIFHDLFNTAPIGLREWAYLVIWPPIIILLDELRKGFLRRWDKRNEKNNKKSE